MLPARIAVQAPMSRTGTPITIQGHTFRFFFCGG
jgi:hypothetical protein